MSEPITHSRQALGLYERSCRKNRYADKKAAVSEINRQKPYRGRHGQPEHLEPYYCGHCGGWHLTKRKIKK